MNVSAKKVDLAHLAAVLLEVAAWKPDLRPELNRDFQRVQTLVESRGMPVLMIDFPSAGKVLDLALSSERINPINLPVLFGKVSGPSRLLFGCLFRMIFNDDCTVVYNEDTHRAVFLLRQILYMYKKVKLACSDERVEMAINEFLRIEDDMREPTNSWDLDHFDKEWSTDVSFFDGIESYERSHADGLRINRKLLGIFQVVCDRIFGSYPEVQPLDLQPRHGSGAVSDVKTGTDKYRLPFWPAKLGEVFPFHDFALPSGHYHLEDLEQTEMSFDETEYPSKLIAVPKTLDKPRIIASEPTAHMFCQEAVLMWLRDRMPSACKPYVSFTDQGLSQQLALKASKSGDLATVDLSSASDRLSCWTVERAMRKNVSLLHTLFAVRTRYLKFKMPRSNVEGQVRLRKYAPQGNATTFPVQTLIYTCAALASVLFEDGRKPTTRNMRAYSGELRVFGDDIIVPSRAVGNLASLLSYLGLKVNMGKTHYRGHFRESCGMDAFDGEDVSPCYLAHLESDSTAERVTSHVDVSNNAYNMGLWLLADYLVAQIPSRVRRRLIVSREPLSGITLATFQESPSYLKSRRWNKKLHLWEVPALRVSVKTVQGERMSPRNLLQYFLERPKDVDLPLGYVPMAPLKEKNFRVGFLRRTSSSLKRTWVSLKE